MPGVNTPFPLARVAYAAGTDVALLTTTATAMTAVDTTNCRATFVIPPSGKVRVRIESMADMSTTQGAYFGVLEGATVKASAWVFGFSGSTGRWGATWIISGQTPGLIKSWDFAVKTASGGTMKVWSGPNYGQIIMEVDALA